MNYYSLTDQQFALIEPIFTQERDRRGRKPLISDRLALEGVLYILREGCRWRALPDFFGNWMTVFMRYKRWIERGVLWKVLMRLQKAHVLEVKVAFMDITMVRAHCDAAGVCKKGGQALGCSKGGLRGKAPFTCRQLRTIIGHVFVGRAGERAQV